MMKNVLLIDDDPDEAELFRDVLLEIDPSVSFEFASSAKRALNGLADGMIHPDVIFLDINMPEMDGWECLRQCKAIPACRDIPVYMYSTSRNDKDRSAAREMGAVRLITKHYNYQKFKDHIGSILSGETGCTAVLLPNARVSGVRRLFEIVRSDARWLRNGIYFWMGIPQNCSFTIRERA